MEPIIRQLLVGPMQNFAYLFGCAETRKVALIDPAAEAGRLLGEVEAQGAELVSIIVTHSHIDHVAAVAAVKKQTGVPVIAHRDAHLGRLDPISAQFLPMLGGEPPPRADELVDDGAEIAVGDQSLRVIHVPGHTPGDVALYTPGAVFTGDCLFVDGIGRTDLPGSSERQLLVSLTEKLGGLPDETVVYPGHDYGRTPTSTIGEQKKTNPFMQLRLA